MKKEVSWLTSRCISSVLSELSKKPLTPMQLRAKTGLTKNNYANIILRRLESKKIIKCLNPEETIGKVYGISPENLKTVANALKIKGINQKVIPPPSLNWKAYGKLQCPYCTQLRNVFIKANELRLECRAITPYTIMEKLPGLATSDAYRALNRLAQLNILIEYEEKPKRFMFNSDGLKIIEFDSEILI